MPLYIYNVIVGMMCCRSTCSTGGHLCKDGLVAFGMEDHIEICTILNTNTFIPSCILLLQQNMFL